MKYKNKIPIPGVTVHMTKLTILKMRRKMSNGLKLFRQVVHK